MLFKRNTETKDPIVGVDIGTETTYLAGDDPNDNKRVQVMPSDETDDIAIPTRVAALDDEIGIGHESDELYERGAITLDILGPFHFGKEKWETNVFSLEEDPAEGPRREYFEYLFDTISKRADNWENRIAIPVRGAMPESGYHLLDKYLNDAGFVVEKHVNTAIASAIGYWERDSRLDQHFDLDYLDGAVVLAVDMGAKYLDTAVISVQSSKYRILASRDSRRVKTPIELYSKIKADEYNLEFSPSIDNAAQYFGLQNQVGVHFPALIRGEKDNVEFTVPDEFGKDGGVSIELRSAEVQAIVANQMESYERYVVSTIEDAGLDSVDDLDLVVPGGLSTYWIPFLQWWAKQGARKGKLLGPDDTDFQDCSVRLAPGVGGKTLAAKGASILAHSEVGHDRRNIEIIS